MKKFCLSFIFMMLVFTSVVNANSINSIIMDVYIDANGDAEVTEVWDCTTNQSTESYHPYYNFGKSEITNLQVKDEDGITYTPISYWNVNDSFENKKYKCGINETNNGVELCWGISEYGRKTYTVNYEITDFVVGLPDSQMVYWTFMPHNFSNTIGNIEITVRADKRFEDTLDVWGYGEYGAPTYVYDGVVKMHSDGNMTSDEYKVLLIKFPIGTFNTSVNLNNNFDYYLNMANDGAVKYEEKAPTLWEKIVTFISTVFMIAFTAFIFYIIYANLENIELSKETKKALKDPEYYRDIPCNANMFKIFYLASIGKLFKKQTDLMGAIILKWLKEGKVSIRKQEGTGLLKKEESVVVFNNEKANEIENEKEKSLFKYMYEASKDGVLEKKELEKWCKTNYNKILTWFSEIVINEKKACLNSGELQKVKLGNFLKRKRIVLSPEFETELLNVAGLKKYLNDYTLIMDRESIEVALFEDYLIFAQIVGIADKVIKEFKDLYPEIIEASSYESYDNIAFIRTTTYKGITAANTARSRAESYSSGGGGFSSGGGGGGSFGGGSSGGGGFR